MLKFDSLYNPYPSQRHTVFARRGMVATAQPLASQAGLRMLEWGGSAVDAAVATAAVLTVVEPTSNGIGGDAFALVWEQDTLHGLNSSGPAPKGLSIEAVQALGHDAMPSYGWIPVTVPGAPAAWGALNKRFGRLPLSEVLRPAVEYAEDGFPVSPVVADAWQRAVTVYRQAFRDSVFAEWFRVFAPKGRAPLPGEMWRSPQHADSLRRIGATEGDDFYRGELAERIASWSRQSGGFLTAADLASFSPEWVEPISQNYRGYDVWELPPNGQGLVALMALGILEGLRLEGRESVETAHLQIEALKQAFVDGQVCITDPKHMSVDPRELLSPAYAAARRAHISDWASEPTPGCLAQGGTVYVAAADAEGQMVSFIQSNYMGFGSGIVVPGTGISLQNRGHTFSLDTSAVNCLRGGKRTYHTIIPGFLSKDRTPIGPFGVMGGFMQPQAHLQVMSSTLDFGLNPQAALDAPRWQWHQGRRITVEPGFSSSTAQALIRRGHEVEAAISSGSFGRGQIIWRDPNGVLAGGTESRADGSIAGW